MKKLLEIAMEKADQAEVFHVVDSSGSLEMRNATLTEISSSITAGYAIRVIKDGKLGTAYTKNLLNRTELVSNALSSLKAQVEVAFRFPGSCDAPALNSYSESMEGIGFREVKQQCSEVIEYFDGKTEGQLDVQGGFYSEEIFILNSSGLDVSQKHSGVYTFGSLLFPNTETRITEGFLFREPRMIPVELLERQLETYRAGLPEVDIPSGRMKVIFMPSTMYALMWRLGSATGGRAFYNKVTPLLEKLGEKVISDKLTIYDDQRDPVWNNPRAFDDEGVPTRKLELFDKGVFRNVFVNLDYADKLGIEPTSSGYRSGPMGGDSVTLQPAPALNAIRVAPGEASWDEMVRSMDKGVILFGLLGAHSGNIVNGDFSVGLSPGLYVENGIIVGRVKDGMASGNVYDILGRVIAVENQIHNPHGFNRLPCIQLEDVSVAARE